jgi:choline dehydrogenase-like flavoprotein
MAERDLGRATVAERLLDSDLWFPDTVHEDVGGYHHMGTTRMAESPDKGVVDKDLRVFGIDNFYIGDSSVFTTCGHVNPTFTIVELSLRLADHVDTRRSR